MRLRLIAMLFVLTAGWPARLLACPVCFGQSDSPMAKAVNLSILAMLVVVAGMLGAFATFFITLVRRSKMSAMDATEGAGAGTEEGPVRC